MADNGDDLLVVEVVLGNAQRRSFTGAVVADSQLNLAAEHAAAGVDFRNGQLRRSLHRDTAWL